MNALAPIEETADRQTSAGDGTDIAAELAALRAIIDELDAGIVVLDKARHVQFVNRAFRRFWRVPDEWAQGRPSFIKLMYCGRGLQAYAVTADKLGDYVAKQLELIRTGNEHPLSIRLTNGQVVTFRCKALPDGGRLLTYVNVNELADQAESLERLARTDALTGLNNRRHFLALAQTEWSRFLRYGRPLSLLMINIDLFKSINDTCGRDAGDEVLKTLAKILQKHKRASDIAGRLGGEEFAVLLPDTPLESAVAAADRLRHLVADCVITVEKRRMPVTVSVGASTARAEMTGFDELLKEADIALYEAKRSGSNQVCQFILAGKDSRSVEQSERP